ncbi:MAG: DUF559 domain-containing protein [Stellaceae bacterium]
MPSLRARELRQTMTDAERRLWYVLRDRRLRGYEFRRQLYEFFIRRFNKL